ncbi:MAG: hypothetical protein KAG97_11270 [Victivallales bacterium]|nr:hypothetical protein [Victivallales bacterium]
MRPNKLNGRIEKNLYDMLSAVCAWLTCGLAPSVFAETTADMMADKLETKNWRIGEAER